MPHEYLRDVYIVYRESDYEGGEDEIMGIYVSEKRAQDYINRHSAGDDNYYIDDSCQVDERNW